MGDTLFPMTPATGREAAHDRLGFPVAVSNSTTTRARTWPWLGRSRPSRSCTGTRSADNTVLDAGSAQLLLRHRRLEMGKTWSPVSPLIWTTRTYKSRCSERESPAITRSDAIGARLASCPHACA